MISTALAGSASFDALAGRRVERADAAPRAADGHDLADLERAGLDEHGGDVATALVDLRLDDRADRVAIGVRLEVLEVGDEEDHLHEVVDAGALLGADRDGDHVAAVLLDEDVVVGQLLLHPVGLGIGLVDLVDRHDHRHAGGADVVDRLLGLRHDAVVGRDHDDRDVGDLRAARTHGGERLVARGVEEDDPLVVVDDLGRTDVLGDPAGLAGGDLRLADRVEQARLAVVDVAHDGDDRRTGAELVGILVGPQRRPAAAVLGAARLDELLAGGLLGRGTLGDASLGRLEAELARDERGGVEVDRLVDGREDPVLDQDVDDLGMADRELLGEVLDDHRVRQLDGSGRPGRRGLGLGDGCGGSARALALRSRPASRAVSTWRHRSPRFRAVPAGARHRALA